MRITRITADQAERVDLGRVDLFDPAFHAAGDPHMVWAAMRKRAPLHRQELPDGRVFWSVTRYHDACRVLGNHWEFTSERGNLIAQLGHGDAAAGKMLAATDPPRHGELRRPLNRMFTGRDLEASTERIRDAVRVLFVPALDGGDWDLAERATMLPMAIAGMLMDLPEHDWADLVKWTGMAAAPQDPAFMIRNGQATLAITHHRLFQYFSEQLDARKEMIIRGAELTREEIIFNCYSLLLGANATTPHTVTGTVLALMEHPDQYRAVADDRTLIPALVEEGLRWTSSASGFLRHAVADAEFASGVVPAGGAVAIWVGSANRDENVFHDPYRFDAARQENRHIAFGFGPHYCLGAAVARITLRIFFEEALKLVEEFIPAGEPRHLASTFVAGFTSLRVRTRLRRTASAPSGR